MRETPSPSPKFQIRPAFEGEAPIILALIKELAEYEKLSHEVEITEDQIREHLFGARPRAEVLLGFADGEAVGYALFFHNFSTFAGRPGLYLEDVYIKPAHRRRGYGKAFFYYLARVAKERNCARFEWTVLDWNKPAIDFYKSTGAVGMEEWTIYRLAGEALAAFAKMAEGNRSRPIPRHDD